MNITQENSVLYKTEKLTTNNPLQQYTISWTKFYLEKATEKKGN